MKPGHKNLPPRSMTLVASPTNASMPASSPTYTMSPPRTATACATSPSFTSVCTWPFLNTRSAALPVACASASMLVSAAPSSAGALHPNGPPSSIPAASTDAPATNERRVSALCRPSPWFVLCVMTIPSFPCSTIRLPDPLCRRHLARRYGRRGPATINAKMDACSKEGLFFSPL